MKIDTHILFLILIVGIISAGLVGANVLNSDQSMKQEVFDGIKVSVPSDSNFVKAADGVYKDSNNGITLYTFKNNESMVKYLKNTKNSKVVPVENQPPQSVAFKKGNFINILVTNGQEGICVCSKDGELTARIANNVVFSDNHKTQKPVALNIINPPMDTQKDFNLIMLIVADVDTNIFNTAILQENLVIVENDYNAFIDQPLFVGNLNIDSDNITVEDNSDSNNILSADTQNSSADSNQTTVVASSESSNSNAADNNDSNELTAALADVSPSNAEEQSASNNNPSGSAAPASEPSSGSSVSASPAQSSSSPSSSPSSSSSSGHSNSNPQKMSLVDCKNLAKSKLPSNFNIGTSDQSGDIYVFHVKDNKNKDAGVIRVDSATGTVDDTGLIK